MPAQYISQEQYQQYIQQQQQHQQGTFVYEVVDVSDDYIPGDCFWVDPDEM